jgi:predicted MPP superfamily phosphohydrolase
MTGLRLICLSDTHGRHDDLEVPEGDVLLHAGDFSKRGGEREIADFGRFLARQPHRHKIVVAGNHDFLCQRQPERARELLGDVLYLDGESATVAGLRVFGSPWQPWFHDWAFNLPRGPALAAHWATAPPELDLLLTHTPPAGVLDRTRHGEHVGCADLAAALSRLAPKLHVFGHIHEDRGLQRLPHGGLAVNACNCDLAYRAVHPAVVIDWSADGPREAVLR